MYRPSNAFLNRVGKDPFVVWIVGETNSVAVDDCTITLGWGGEQFTLGSACAGEWKATVLREDMPLVKGERVRLEIGLNGVAERVPMGVYTLAAVRRDIDDDRYTLTGRDAIGETLEEFYGGTGTVTASAALKEICRRGGFAVPQVTVPEEILLSVEEKSMRSLLSELALLCGGNAAMDRFGALRVGGWSGDVCDLGVEEYYQSKLQVDEEDYVLGLLEIKDGDKTYQAQLEGMQQGLKLQGSMNQAAFDRIWAKWQQTAFRPGQVELPDGMWLDPGDLLRITDSRGQRYTMPVLQVTYTFDGGFRTLVRAKAAEVRAAPPQTVSQAVNGLKVEVGRFRKVYADKLEATAAAVERLQTDVLQARTILVSRPDGDVILRADAETGELIATSGTVGGMTMSSHTLSAECRYDYPKFTQADLDRAQEGILGTVTLTEEEREKYDVNMDGRLSSVDLLAMSRMISGQEKPYSVYRFTIDPTRPNACIQVAVVDGYHAGWSTELGVGMARVRDLTVSGQMTLQGEQLSDFVVRRGFDSDWEWRLWSSGLADCWCIHTFAPVQLEAWGSMYSSVEQGIQPLMLPVEFVEEPVCTMSLVNVDYDCILMAAAGEDWDRLMYTPPFQLIRPTMTNSGTVQPTVAFRVIGRWK